MSLPQSMISAVKKVSTDGWLNVLTGLGMKSKDKRMGATVSYWPMGESIAEQLYAADDVAAAIVDTLPEDALRQWFTLSSDVPDLAQQIDSKFDQIHLNDRLAYAWKWGRLYGGAALLINVDDSRDLSSPLLLDQVRELRSLTLLTRYELHAKDIDLDISSPRFGEPLTYSFQPQRNDVKTTGTVIHWTRLLPFYGVKLPHRQTISNGYWGDSVLTRLENPIRNYNVSHDSAATILQEFNQGIFKIKNLAQMLLAGEDEAVQRRLETINLARSVCRAVVIDEDEEYTNVGASVTGIPEMLTKVGERLVVASRMPHTKILGQSPSGLGATGESEAKNWNDFVSNQQELVLRPKIAYLIEILLRSRKGPTSGKVPGQWSFEFAPLEQPNEKEQIETRKLQAEVDKIYIDSQVCDPEEIAQSRFGEGKFSFETKLDENARAALTEPDEVVA